LKRKSGRMEPEYNDYINYDIKQLGDRVRIIKDDGTSEEVSLQLAMVRAQADDLDLVCIAPNAQIPVCRICDYSKYQYDRKKQEKEKRAKQKQSSSQQKFMKYRVRIDDNDYNTKTSKVREMLLNGDTVNCVIMFRGRECSHTELGIDILNRIIADMSDIAIVRSEPQVVGRDAIMTLQLDRAKAKDILDEREKKRAAQGNGKRRAKEIAAD